MYRISPAHLRGFAVELRRAISISHPHATAPGLRRGAALFTRPAFRGFALSASCFQCRFIARWGILCCYNRIGRGFGRPMWSRRHRPGLHRDWGHLTPPPLPRGWVGTGLQSPTAIRPPPPPLRAASVDRRRTQRAPGVVRGGSCLLTGRSALVPASGALTVSEAASGRV